ncbi:MAG: hypothetical protein V4719_20465 [Planctomycetota bacterium]
MSIRRKSGEQVDVTDRLAGDLSVLEQAYLSAYPNRRKHVAIWGLREGLNWKYREIAEALRISEGHASRIHHLVHERILTLGKKFQTELALCRPADDEN